MPAPTYREIRRPVTFNAGRETLLFGTIARRLQIGKWANPDDDGMDGINLDPDYQRDHVWTVEQQEAFVGHMLEGGVCPIFIFRRDDTYTHADEIIDGKQRITAIAQWIRGEIAAELTDGNRHYLKDFAPKDQKFIMGISGPHMDAGYVSLDRADILRLYLRLNRGGTVHTNAEINRVRALLAEASI